MTDKSAKVYGRSLPVSTKTSVEMCSFLRGMSYARALKVVSNVLEFKQAVPFTRFIDGVGHRKGKMAAGRYPQKLSQHMKELLLSAKSNADDKGLSDSLVVAHICAHKAATPFHNGRQRRRAMKKTHIELVLEEFVPTTNKKVETKQKPITKETPKPKVTEMPKVESKSEVAQKPVISEPKADVAVETPKAKVEEIKVQEKSKAVEGVEQ